jgi:hypothetical protein
VDNWQQLPSAAGAASAEPSAAEPAEPSASRAAAVATSARPPTWRLACARTSSIVARNKLVEQQAEHRKCCDAYQACHQEPEQRRYYEA